jgi:hypothetical protein
MSETYPINVDVACDTSDNLFNINGLPNFAVKEYSGNV